MITLVFTDVVGSSGAKRDAVLGSSLSERDRAYLESIQTEHLRLIRSATAKHKGREIMTMGDGFFLTFEDAVDALRCCAAIQRRLVELPIDTPHGPLRLRIAIHMGTPEFFENSWHGTDVDIAARAQSVASPRQIIVTAAAREVLGEPFGITLRPLGSFTLKGVGSLKLWDADYDEHGRRSAAIRSNEQKRQLNSFSIMAMATALIIAASLGAWYLWLEHLKDVPVITAKTASSIIVAEFENKTGEPLFDSTLTQAFTIQLQQSPVLRLVTAEHLRQSMQYLGKSPDDPLTPAVAREIGVREGVKAYITGSISKIGDAYLIIANAINAETGDSIASEQAQAADRDHVLDALSSVATQMRTELGESLASIQKLDTPLGQATTPSLEAFRALALGDSEHLKGDDIPGAEGHYQQALELDPNFAMAWARLGAVYSNGGQFGKSLKCFTRAFELSKNVSERERFFILGNYYVSVTGNIQKMIDTAELACRTYPLDSTFYTELGVAQNAIGQISDSLASFQQALALAPDSAIANSNYLNALSQLDRYEDALNVVASEKRLGLNDTDDAIYTYSLHLLTGNSAEMPKDIMVTKGRDDDYLMTGTVAYGQEFRGQYREADRSWKRAALQAGLENAKDAQAGYLLIRLTGRALAKMSEKSGPELSAALNLDRTKPTLQLVAFTAAICNQPSIALPIIQELARSYPEDTIINKITIPQSRAALALGADRPQSALENLEGADAYDLITPSAYLEGLADLKLNDGAGAVRAFQRAVRYRGTALMGGAQDYGQAQLGLARAFRLTGDKDSERKAYEALFVTWKDADTDLPQLLAAKKEYADLK